MGAGYQQNQPVIGGLELSVLPPNFLWEKEKGRKLDQSPEAGDLINLAYLIKLP